MEGYNLARNVNFVVENAMFEKFLRHNARLNLKREEIAVKINQLLEKDRKLQRAIDELPEIYGLAPRSSVG